MVRTMTPKVVGIVVAVASLGMAPFQLLPPPGDGEIRMVYWELQNVSDVFLTLEPRAANGDRAPVVTFTQRFPGRRPTTPPKEVEVRALAGQFWAPRGELWFALDETVRIDLTVYGNATTADSGSDSWAGSISMATLRQMTLAQRVSGNALGFPLELSGSQRRALRTFFDRISSGSGDRARP